LEWILTELFSSVIQESDWIVDKMFESLASMAFGLNEDIDKRKKICYINNESRGYYKLLEKSR